MHKGVLHSAAIVVAVACGCHSRPTLADPISAGAVAPVGAEVSLMLNEGNLSGARFVILPHGREAIMSEGDSIRYWSTNAAAVSSELPHSREPIYEDGDDRSGYYRDMLCVSPDGERVASGGYSGFVERRMSDGKVLFDSGSMLEGISDIQYSKDGALLLMSGYGSVSVWDTVRKRMIRTMSNHLSLFDAAFDGSGAFVVTASADEAALDLWETGTGRLVRSYLFADLPRKADDENGFSMVRFSHDNKNIFAAQTSQQRVLVWNINGRDTANDVQVGELSTYIVGHDDGSLIVGYKNGDISVWSLQDRKAVKTIHTGRGPIVSLSESREGDKLVVSGGKYFQLVDMVGGKVVATFFVADNHGVAYTPKGLFVTDGDPRKAFKIMLDGDELPVDDFIRLNRRTDLDEAVKSSH